MVGFVLKGGKYSPRYLHQKNWLEMWYETTCWERVLNRANHKTELVVLVQNSNHKTELVVLVQIAWFNQRISLLNQSLRDVSIYYLLSKALESRVTTDRPGW
jgi:hypothetical protein